MPARATPLVVVAAAAAAAPVLDGRRQVPEERRHGARARGELLGERVQGGRAGAQDAQVRLGDRPDEDGVGRPGAVVGGVEADGVEEAEEAGDAGAGGGGGGFC